MAAPARADVLDIGENGETTLVRGPSVIRSTNLQHAIPIAPRQRQASTAAPAPSVVAVRQADRSQIMASISHAADWVGLPSKLIEAVAWQESHFHQGAVSPRGAVGVMQLMPGTARSLGVEPTDTNANIHGGALYLRQMVDRYNGDLTKALAAYNAGPGAIDRFAGVPPFPETRNYVASIMGRLRAQNFFQEISQ